MNAKHAKVKNLRGGGLKYKLLCVFMAFVLLTLMVPNGLRANATEKVNVAESSEQAQDPQGGQDAPEVVTPEVDPATPAESAEAATDANASETAQQQNTPNAKNEIMPFNVSLSFEAVGEDYGSTDGYFNVYAGHYPCEWWVWYVSDLIEWFEKDTKFYEDEFMADTYYDDDYYPASAIEDKNDGMGRLDFSVDVIDWATGEPIITSWETTITPVEGPIVNSSNETISSFKTWEVRVNEGEWLDLYKDPYWGSVSLEPNNKYELRAVFKDVEDVTLVHLDLDGACANQAGWFAEAMQDNGWWPTNYKCNYWTKAITEQTELDTIKKEILDAFDLEEEYGDLNNIFKDYPVWEDTVFSVDEPPYEPPYNLTYQNFDCDHEGTYIEEETTWTAHDYNLLPFGRILYKDENGNLAPVPEETVPHVVYFNKDDVELLDGDSTYEEIDYVGSQPEGWFYHYDWDTCTPRFDTDIAYAICYSDNGAFLPKKITFENGISCDDMKVGFDFVVEPLHELDPVTEASEGFAGFEETVLQDGALVGRYVINPEDPCSIPLVNGAQYGVDEDFNFHEHFVTDSPLFENSNGTENDSYTYDFYLTPKATENHVPYVWKFDGVELPDYVDPYGTFNIPGFETNPHSVSIDYIGTAPAVMFSESEGHDTFHLDYYINDPTHSGTPTACFDDFGPYTDNVFDGSTLTIIADGVLDVSYSDDGYTECGLIAAKPAEGYVLKSWIINGDEYEIGTAQEGVLTFETGVPCEAEAIYAKADVPQPEPTPVTPESVDAQTGDSTPVVVFAILVLTLISVFLFLRRPKKVQGLHVR